jgi:hypothetical protein
LRGPPRARAQDDRRQHEECAEQWSDRAAEQSESGDLAEAGPVRHEELHVLAQHAEDRLCEQEAAQPQELDQSHAQPGHRGAAPVRQALSPRIEQ